jgi:hypothetical protein
VTSPDLGTVLVLAATVTCTVALPLPALGLVAIHDTGDATVQLQSAFVRTSIASSPPAAGAVVSDESTVYRQGAAS